MNRIARYVSLLEVVSVISILIMAAQIGSTWISAEGINSYDASVSGLFVSYNNEAGSCQVIDHVAAMPWQHRALGLLVDLISLAIMIYAIWCFIRLLRAFRSGSFFSPTTVTLLRQLTISAFVWALYNPIRYMLMSVIVSWHQKPRFLSIALGTNDMINIFIFGIFVLITALIQEGYRLQQERDLTI